MTGKDRLKISERHFAQLVDDRRRVTAFAIAHRIPLRTMCPRGRVYERGSESIEATDVTTPLYSEAT